MLNKKVLVQDEQICKFEIETCDENDVYMLQESAFYGTINPIPETLPIPALIMILRE